MLDFSLACEASVPERTAESYQMQELLSLLFVVEHLQLTGKQLCHEPVWTMKPT